MTRLNLTPKYGNRKTEVDNVNFDSRKEAARYQDLKLLLGQGVIANLQVQPRYPLVVQDVLVATYVADFEYLDCEHNRLVTEDVKTPPTRTPVYRLKKKLMKALYNIDILET